MTDGEARQHESFSRRKSRPDARYQPRSSRADTDWGALYAPSPGVDCSVLGGEAVLLNLESGRSYTLNRVGTMVWEQLDGRRPLAAVLSALTESFNAPETQLRRDLLALVRQLRAEGLIEERR
jgi:hypothetical protein